jgi:hypothetical protein
MFKLTNTFKIGDEVKLLVKDGYFQREVKGKIIEEKMRFDQLEYVINVDGEIYQVPTYFVSYCNSEDFLEIEGYKSVKEYLPKLGKDILLCYDSYGIKYLTVRQGSFAGGYHSLSLDWYPDGKPLCNSEAWMEIPKYIK